MRTELNNEPVNQYFVNVCTLKPRYSEARSGCRSQSPQLPIDKFGCIHAVAQVKMFTIRHVVTKNDLCLSSTVIGGSLAKLAYFSKVSRKRIRYPSSSSNVLDPADELNPPATLNDHDPVVHECSFMNVETEEQAWRLHFINFETKYIETCLDFVKRNFVRGARNMNGKTIKVTGGGAYKYKDLITDKLGFEVSKEDEIQCLIEGCNFLLKNIPDESFMYHRHGDPQYEFMGLPNEPAFPYLLVNIGSGVSILKVESDTTYERIGGTSLGGGSFWGLGSLLTKAKGFDELLELAERGDHRSVDMLVKDIYGGSYDLIGLPGDVIASSFGRAARSPRDASGTQYKEEDIARSLLISISNDIGQIACLNAKLHGIKRIYFGGFFIRCRPITMYTLTFAINYWSKGEIQALFLRHEGYLGAIGAFLKGTQESIDAHKYSWDEHLPGSSGLQHPVMVSFMRQNSSKVDFLELDCLEQPLASCPLLLSTETYSADTWDLAKDAEARDYWISCFERSVNEVAERAAQSQNDQSSAGERADKFKSKYLQKLSDLREQPFTFGSLTVRTLLDTRQQYLDEFQFSDPYLQQRIKDDEEVLQFLPSHLASIDAEEWPERQRIVVQGLLAGTSRRADAREHSCRLTNNASVEETISLLRGRRWLLDDLDAWIARLEGEPHRCAVIFVDSSGFDIIMGIFPFARELLRRGTDVILCTNSKPVMNEVTYSELFILAHNIAAMCDVIGGALAAGRLVVMESGQHSPCLDLSRIDERLVAAMALRGADLVLLEGVSKAVHTNHDARFRCDAIKVAIVDDAWLAGRLGGAAPRTVFSYEPAPPSGPATTDLAAPSVL
ncbi:PREDICTED: pantothenate kinase 4-like [Priapulus caudatus]|uniref:4'-phosphopantetheine phosphatase n=1 Tax=Priapulus caudatus TaxID=37621 RepID=A0ABM1EPT7_PRICU|nr:PREDICTED: pantothenate kinase 4-like [Priapulus caudatus]